MFVLCNRRPERVVTVLSSPLHSTNVGRVDGISVSGAGLEHFNYHSVLGLCSISSECRLWKSGRGVSLRQCSSVSILRSAMVHETS